MLNVLLPMAGISPLSEELGYPYPSPLVEICGVPLIQRVIENFTEFWRAQNHRGTNSMNPICTCLAITWIDQRGHATHFGAGLRYPHSGDFNDSCAARWVKA